MPASDYRRAGASDADGLAVLEGHGADGDDLSPGCTPWVMAMLSVSLRSGVTGRRCATFSAAPTTEDRRAGGPCWTASRGTVVTSGGDP